MSVLPDSIVYRRKQSAGLARDASAAVALDSPARPRPASISRNVVWTLAGNLTYAVCQWGMLIVLARLGEPEMLGQYVLGFAITAPIVMFANLQLRAVQATDAAGKYAFGDYLALRLTTSATALVAICAIAAGVSKSLASFAILLAIGVAKVLESISDVVYGLLQRHEQMASIGQSMLLKGPLSLVALGLGVYVTGSLLLGITASAGTFAAILLLYDLPVAARTLSSAPEKRDALAPCWSAARLRSLAWESLPLGFVMMLISLNTNVPRYFVEAHLGTRELGIFAALTYCTFAGTVVIQALGQAAVPRLAVFYHERRRDAFRYLMLRLVLATLLLGLGSVLIAWLLGAPLLQLIYGREYAEASGLLVWMTAAGSLAYLGSILGYGITAAGRFHRFTLPYLMVTVMGAIAAAILVPLYGLLGAAWAGGVTALAGCLAPLYLLHLAWRDQ